MKIRVRIDLAFDLANRAQAEKLRDALLAIYQYSSNINKGEDNEEIGYIDIENCRHDEGKPCEKIGRWEVGRGRIF